MIEGEGRLVFGEELAGQLAAGNTADLQLASSKYVLETQTLETEAPGSRFSVSQAWGRLPDHGSSNYTSLPTCLYWLCSIPRSLPTKANETAASRHVHNHRATQRHARYGVAVDDILLPPRPRNALLSQAPSTILLNQRLRDAAATRRTAPPQRRDRHAAVLSVW